MTYGELATEVCDIVDRQDMLTTATKYVRDAIRTMCSRVPFDEMRYVGESLIGAGSIGLNASSFTPEIVGFSGTIYVRCENWNSRTARRLTKTDMKVLDSLPMPDARGRGMPAQYARRTVGSVHTIYLNPIPDTTYNISWHYWRQHPLDPTLANTVILLPDEWIELARYEALDRLYIRLGEHDKSMFLHAGTNMPRQFQTRHVRTTEIGIIPRLWNDLLRTTFQKEAPDDNFGLRPRS